MAGSSNGLERKAKLIVQGTSKNYKNEFTPEQYEFELKVAYMILAALNVTS